MDNSLTPPFCEYEGWGKVIYPTEVIVCDQGLSCTRRILSDPPYSPNLAPSGYHLFNLLKEDLRGKHYASDKKVKTSVMKLLKEHSK